MKITASALLALVLALPGPAVSAGWDEVLTMLGPNDAAVAADKHGRILFAHNPDKHLVPASAIKLVTALVSLSVLGENFRFKTEFYTDNEKNLYIKGYGDPLLVSEQVESISEKLAARLGSVNDIVADDTYFAEKIEIPGTRSYSHQPYDSPAGALCVNFNTAAVKKTGSGYISAEPQTPLLPRVLAKARSFDAETGRILLSGKNRENLMYAGELFAHFLEKHGTEINGVIRPGTAKPAQHRLIY
ncbi:MAG: D-alanyl-D-alanine carboxypeptidase, partial [Desulfosalsimonas sp.]